MEGGEESWRGLVAHDAFRLELAIRPIEDRRRRAENSEPSEQCPILLRVRRYICSQQYESLQFIFHAGIRERETFHLLATRTPIGVEIQHDRTLVARSLREKLATLCKEMGRFEQALMHQEARYALNEEMFNRGTDLRIKTLQIQHDTEAARQQSEILRLRTSELESMVQLRTEQLESFQIEALERVAVMAEFRNIDTAAHPISVADLAAEIAAELGEPADYVDRLRTAARLHDIGKSGWWMLITLIPLVGPLIMLFFMVKDSQPGTNEYGPNPKEAVLLPA